MKLPKKLPNRFAQALASPLYHKKVIADKKKYSRKALKPAARITIFKV